MTIKTFIKEQNQVLAEMKKISKIYPEFIRMICSKKLPLTHLELKGLWAMTLGKEFYADKKAAVLLKKIESYLDEGISQEDKLITVAANFLGKDVLDKFLQDCIITHYQILHWSLNKHIYQLDKDLAYMLVSETDKISELDPVVLEKIPEWGLSVYLDIHTHDCHIEAINFIYFDNKLNIVYHYYEDGKLQQHSFYFTLDKVMSIDEYMKVLQVDEKLPTEECMIFKIALPILLYFCSDNFLHRETNIKTESKKSVSKRGEFLPPSKETIYQVGIKDGDAIRKFHTESKRYESNGDRTVRPHVRRAHWHSYWIKKDGLREKILRFIPVTFVNMKEDI